MNRSPTGDTSGTLLLPTTGEWLELVDEDSDAALLQGVAVGDRLAFRRFYERFSGKVASSLQRLCRGRQVEEDLFQEVFLAIWHKAQSFDPARGDVAGWVFTICRNKAYDHFRRSDPPSVEVHEADAPFEPADRDLRLALESAMGELRVEERDALRMVYIGGFTYEATAARLAVPLGTLKSRLRAALRKLATTLAGDA